MEFDHRGLLQAAGILGGTLVIGDLPTLLAEAGTQTDMLCVQDCLPGSGPSKRAIVSISSSVLRENNGVIGGVHGAAACLGLRRTTLHYRLEKIGISQEPD